MHICLSVSIPMYINLHIHVYIYMHEYIHTGDPVHEIRTWVRSLGLADNGSVSVWCVVAAPSRTQVLSITQHGKESLGN